MQSHSVSRDLGTSTVCHHLAAFWLPFNRSLLNELNKPVSVHASPRPLALSSGGSLVPSQVQFEDKLHVSGVVLASQLIQARYVHGIRIAFQLYGYIVCAIEMYAYTMRAQSMDCPRRVRIHDLRSAIHGLCKSMLCAQHIHSYVHKVK